MELINPNKYIQKNKFVPSKKMGQNFLVDQDVIDQIINEVSQNDFDAIIEIGPGLGAISKYLVEFNKPLYLIELDKRLYSYLNERFKDVNNVSLINNDVLKMDLDEIAIKYKNCIIVSNLPYSISSLVIIQFLKTKNIQTMFCMLQKEVVDRLQSLPKHKEYNAFSVLSQHLATTTKLIDVPKNCFVPAPEVFSNFIQIKKNKNKYDLKFDKFLHMIFLAKRKTLLNNLKHFYSKDQIERLFNKFNLSSTIRSEEIDHKTLYKMYNYLTNHVS